MAIDQKYVIAPALAKSLYPSPLSVGWLNSFFHLMVQREGFVLQFYPDRKGYGTIGLGHLASAGGGFKPGDVITAEQAIDLFKKDVKRNRIEEICNKLYSH